MVRYFERPKLILQSQYLFLRIEKKIVRQRIKLTISLDSLGRRS